MWFFTLCNNIVRFEDWMLRRKRFIPHGRASKGEREVEAVLKRHGIQFEAQYELGYYVHVDFAIYHNDRMYLVEYDGRQHYHPVKYFGGRWKFFLQRWKDIMEGWECKDRGIPLLRIKYNVPLDKIESILLNFLNDDR